MRFLPAPLLLLAAMAVAGPQLRSAKVDAAVEAVQPSVVKVFGVKGFRGIFGYMTGVIVHESGLVLTRGSVTLDEAPQIKCHLNDGRRFLAELVRYDRKSKMVLLHLLADPGTKFPVAKLGDSDKVRPGNFVLLVGNAYRVAEGREPCAVSSCGMLVWRVEPLKTMCSSRCAMPRSPEPSWSEPTR